MENPSTWSPLIKALNYSDFTEPKEIVDHLIEEELLPKEPYWAMLGAISEAQVEHEDDMKVGRCGYSFGALANIKLNKVLK